MYLNKINFTNKKNQKIIKTFLLFNSLNYDFIFKNIIHLKFNEYGMEFYG